MGDSGEGGKLVFEKFKRNQDGLGTEKKIAGTFGRRKNMGNWDIKTNEKVSERVRENSNLEKLKGKRGKFFA